MPQRSALSDPVTSRLYKAPLMPAMRAQVWDLFQQATDEDDLAERLKALQIPDDVKADLWDLKQSQIPDAASVPNTSAPPDSLYPDFATMGHAALDVGIGAGKALLEQGGRGGALLRKIPGVDALFPKVFEVNTERSNTAQQIGAGLEQIAEVISPGRAITSIGTKLAARMAPRLAPTVTRAAVEGAAAAGLGGLQGGDPMVAGAFGAAGPVVGTAIKRGAAALLPGRTANAVEAAAVRFGEAEGIPIDAATATGSSWVRRAQKRAGDAMGGHLVAEDAQRAQAEALARVGNSLAESANTPRHMYSNTPQHWYSKYAPVGPAVDTVGAGEGIRKSLTDLRSKFGAEADTAYGTLRQIEQKGMAQARTVRAGTAQPIPQMAVDLRAEKAALTPVFAAMKRESELVPLMGDRGRAAVALQRLLEGPDFAPISVVDGALSDLKSLARVTPGSLRTKGQGVMAAAVQRIDAALQARVAKEGPDAVKALAAGREATKAKYAVDAVLDTLSDEPAGIFRQLTRAKDTGVEQLRLVAKHAPDQMPALGRAYLEGLIDTATGEGGFGHADKLWAEWKKVGPETRRIVFPTIAKNLDDFFLLAKTIAKNPNPSGTAGTLNATNLLFAIPSYALAKLMYTPGGVSMLTKGMATGKLNEITSSINRLLATQGSQVGATPP